ncbi:hypothetical protein TNCV_425721 [Trichonephila clavipes]|nr:hypothetical protein TNCV_425721 [Trichonephila clavipes]
MYSVIAAWGNLNIHQAARALVKLEEETEVECPRPSPGYSPSKLGWNQVQSYCHLHLPTFHHLPPTFLKQNKCSFTQGKNSQNDREIKRKIPFLNMAAPTSNCLFRR